VLYVFGGFDQYTDEVYNHVLRLDLITRQWTLVDNFGDIPSVRMGHTTTLWQAKKLLVFGGENEHRVYLSDIIVFDLETARWTAPEVRGTPPRGRARHAAVIYDDKLFIVGGLSGQDSKPSTILDDLCYLDLNTWTWSRIWRFVPRFDHTCWVWGNRLWIFGGMLQGMERVNDLWWYDFKQDPAFHSSPTESIGHVSMASRLARSQHPSASPNLPGNPTHAANSSVVHVDQANVASRPLPMAPGSVSSVKFFSGPSIPTQKHGTHFHAVSSGCLLDLVTPAATPAETGLSVLDLDNMRWEKLAEGREMFSSNYRWQYCALNDEGTLAWLVGCAVRESGLVNGASEYLSDVLPLDLRKLGLLGNSLDTDIRLPASDSHINSHFSGLGADLARFFDKSPDTGSGTDFIVVANRDDAEIEGDDIGSPVSETPSQKASPPIHVHSFILQARWPHFARMISAQMAEFHSKRLQIPEPYSVVRSFLFYLYADTILAGPDSATSLADVAGMLVMANLYDMPRLRTLCRNRLGLELNVEHAALIWDRAGTANEEWLKRRAARFCMTHWGRVVRTVGFFNLRRTRLMELCQEVDTEGRVLGAEELEFVGGLGGARFNGGGVSLKEPLRHRRSTVMVDAFESSDDDQGMELT